MAKIWVLQHHPGEGLGRLAEALQSAALAWQIVKSFDGQPVPKDMKGAGGLIVMGGPQAAYEQDRYPYLRDEIALIQSALRENKPILGICLGSQLVAAAMGAKVERAPYREIGWHPVTLTADGREDRLFRGVPATFTACHWHGDVFDAPRYAVSLASSEKTPCQGFRFGDKVYALLFHIEVTGVMIQQWVRSSAELLRRDNLNADKILDDTERHAPAVEPIAETVFGRWAGPIQGT
ncbi:MAG: type 1 glutamine amidotransferase [Candidatus Binataceae bacterium]